MKQQEDKTQNQPNDLNTLLCAVSDSTFNNISDLIPGISFYDEINQRSMLDGLSEEKQSIFKEIVNEQFFERGIKMNPTYQVYNTKTKELLNV